MSKRYSFITAHPDDETFVTSFIRLAVRQGHDVELVSMTKGEYGTLDRELKGDSVVICRKFLPNNALAAALKGKVGDVRSIGDCVEPGTIRNAIHQGWLAANQI